MTFLKKNGKIEFKMKTRERRQAERLLLVSLSLVLAACGYLGLANESKQPTATPEMAVCLLPKELATAIAGMERYGSFQETEGTPGAMETMRAFMTQFPPDEPTCAPGQIPYPSATPDLSTPGMIVYDGTPRPVFLVTMTPIGPEMTMESVRRTLEAEATAGNN